MVDKIKNVMATSEYDFLRKNIDLTNTILLTVGGSIAYGVNTEASDIDLRGVCIERKQNIYGLGNFEQFENNSTDTVIYGLKKFFNLALKCNPNIIEMLGTKLEHNFVLTYSGQELRKNADIFLSKRIVNSFGGYATAQLRRLQNSLARDTYSQPQKEKHILRSIESYMRSVEEKMKAMQGTLNLYINDSQKEDYDTEIFMNVHLENYPLRDFKNIYSDISNIVKDYGEINHRNKKKDSEHLNKHAMHLLRILIMGTEILSGKGINTYRSNDKAMFYDIRKGGLNYEEIFYLVDVWEDNFQYAAKNTEWPDKPNYKQVEELLMHIYNIFY